MQDLKQIKDLSFVEPRYFLRVGFSEYESKILDALLRYGEMTARELASKTKIPTPKVYQTIKRKLNALVEESPEKPKRFNVDLDDVCKVVGKRKPEAIDAIREYYTHAKEVVSSDFLQRLEEASVAEELTSSAYKAAQHEIEIISGSMRYLRNVQEGLCHAVKNGTKIKVLFPSEELARDAREKFGILERRALLEEIVKKCQPPGMSQNGEDRSIVIKYLRKQKLQEYGANYAWLRGSIIDAPDIRNPDKPLKSIAIFTIEQDAMEKATRYFLGTPVIRTSDPKFILMLHMFFQFLWKDCAGFDFSKKSA